MRRYGCPYCPASIGGKSNYLRHVGAHERNGDRPRPEPIIVPGAPPRTDVRSRIRPKE